MITQNHLIHILSFATLLYFTDIYQCYCYKIYVYLKGNNVLNTILMFMTHRQLYPLMEAFHCPPLA